MNLSLSMFDYNTYESFINNYQIIYTKRGVSKYISTDFRVHLKISINPIEILFCYGIA